MMSPFGVEHVIVKAMMLGGAYKPLKAMTGLERGLVKERLAGPTKPKLSSPLSPARKIWGGANPGIKTPMAGHPGITQTQGPAQGKMIGGQWKSKSAAATFNGRGQGNIHLHGDPHKDWNGADPAKTIKHEMAHIGVKRNPQRFKDRMAFSDAARGREEGRADMIGQGKATPGRYPGNEEFQGGYNEVQGKMTAARQRKRI